MEGLVKNFSSAITLNDADSIKKAINDYYLYSELLLESNEYDNLQKNMFNLKTKIGKIVLPEELGNQRNYFLGKLYGMLEMQDLVLNIYFNRKNKLSAINDNELKMIPHINDIIYNIAKCEGIRHGKLAEKTHLEKNNLTAIMKRLSDYDVVIFNRQGKFKCYYLSEFGQQYYEKNLKMQDSIEYLDYLIDSLAISISMQNNSQHALNRFIEVILNQGKYGQISKGEERSKMFDNVSKLFLQSRIELEPNLHSVKQYSEKAISVEKEYLLITDV